MIERRLANLCRDRFPEAAGQRILIVDDHSTDGTAELAARLVASLSWQGNVRAEVLENSGAPGKANAIRSGCVQLADVDLWVLSDADVVQRPGSILALVEAFEADPRLGLACGAQEFVEALEPGGTGSGGIGGAHLPAGERYDHWTGFVRNLESRWGKLFSVHGQLLAWRRTSGVLPLPGVAADDLSLMFQMRVAGWRSRRIPGAVFLEEKPKGTSREGQKQRRARAYFQALKAHREGLGRRPIDRLQDFLYRRLPGAMPWLWPLLCGLPLIALWAWIGPWAAGLGLVLLIVLHAVGPGRGWVHLLAVIAGAREAEARGGLSDSWEMQRR